MAEGGCPREWVTPGPWEEALLPTSPRADQAHSVVKTHRPKHPPPCGGSEDQMDLPNSLLPLVTVYLCSSPLGKLKEEERLPLAGGTEVAVKVI